MLKVARGRGLYNKLCQKGLLIGEKGAKGCM